MDVELLERRLDVRQSFVRSEMTTPKSKAGKRSMRLGPQAVAALEEQYAETLYRQPEAVVFGHALLGTPLDPSKLTTYARKALKLAGVTDSFRPWHGLRHTALDGDGRGGGAVTVRTGKGWACAGVDDRAVPARGPDELSGGRRARGGPPVRLGLVPRLVPRRAPHRAPFVFPACPLASKAPRVGLEPTTLRLTAGCSAN